METRELNSGLVVPKEKPSRAYGPLEIKNEEKREAAKKALLDVFRASGLNYPGATCMCDGRAGYEAKKKAWLLLAEMLLGDDVPDCEILT